MVIGETIDEAQELSHSAPSSTSRAFMNCFVTGAFGNIGRNTVDALLDKGHRVRALSYEAARDRALVRRWSSRVEVVSGDVRDLSKMSRAMEGQDVVVHLAFVIPPLAHEQPELARTVNMEGTRKVIDAMKRASAPPRLVFASTLDVYGHTQHLPPPRRVTDVVEVTDLYSRHKIECEALVRDSGLTYSILRFADVPPIELRAPHSIMFTIPLWQRIEVIHPRDAGLAVANAVTHDDVWSRVLHVGGGPSCQLTYGAYLNAFLEAMQIGPLPEAWFSNQPYCTDWLDTQESQRLLRYQRHTFEDIVRETAALLGWRAPLARLARPLVRRRLERMSRLVRG